jgi:hypothetical protein
MKKVLFILVAVCFSTIANAQFALTSNGFINSSDETKDYVVIDVPNTSQVKLFKKTKMYLNTLYNNPKFVTSEVENEQVSIDAIDAKEMRIIFVLNGPNIWQFSYKYVFSFKDNKIKFAPVFKSLINTANNSTIDLIGSNVLGTVSGIFNRKGKCLKDKAKTEVESAVNYFVTKLTLSLQEQNDNW